MAAGRSRCSSDARSDVRFSVCQKHLVWSSDLKEITAYHSEVIYLNQPTTLDYSYQQVYNTRGDILLTGSGQDPFIHTRTNSHSMRKKKSHPGTHTCINPLVLLPIKPMTLSSTADPTVPFPTLGYPPPSARAPYDIPPVLPMVPLPWEYIPSNQFDLPTRKRQSTRI